METGSIKRPDVTFYYGLIMFTYSIGYVSMSAFSSVYLLDAGLTNGAVGILLAIGSLISVLLQPSVGSLIDNNPKVTSRSSLLIMGFLIVIFGILTILIPGRVPASSKVAVVSLLYGINISLLMLAQPFLNSLGMDAINYGYPMNFGIGKSLGSLGYALGSFAVGRISVMFGPKSMPVTFSITFFICCIFIFLYPVRKLSAAGENSASSGSAGAAKPKVQINPVVFFSKYKRFAVILVGLILVYFSHALINTFSLQVVVPKGGDSSSMGTASSIAAICELVTIVFFSFYMRKFKLSHLIKISGVFFVLKILFSLLAPNVPVFFLIQGFQMFGWGIMSIGIVYYVNDLVGENDKAQGQAYAGMAYTIASVVSTSLGGYIIDIFGVNAMLISGTICAAIGTAILFISIRELGTDS